MSKNTPWIFVDCEARGTSPVHGVLAEFGAVHYDTRETFHGRLFDATPDPDNPAIPIVGERLASDTEVAERFAAWLKDHLGNKRPVFVSDNPAYDWQWQGACKFGDLQGRFAPDLMAGRVCAGHGVVLWAGSRGSLSRVRWRGCQVTAGLLLGARGVMRRRSGSGGWLGSRWEERSCAAMVGTLRRWRMPMTVLRTAARARCAPLTRLASSPKTTSRT